MYKLGLSEAFLIGYFLITKIIPMVVEFLLIKIFQIHIRVTSVSFLSARMQGINIKWKNYNVDIGEIALKSKFFNSKFEKAVCITCNDAKISSFLNNNTIADDEFYSYEKLKKSNHKEMDKNEFLKDFGFYFNPFAMKVLKNFEIHINNFSLITLNSDMSIKTDMSYPAVKLVLDKYDKRHERVATKKELLLVVKNKDEKWKHFPKTYFLPEFYFFVDNYKNFEVREDDIIISGFPRSGTTRAQEMIWLIANNCDFEGALTHESDFRCPYFDHPGWSFLFRKNTMAGSLEEMKSPRILKTHLPVQLLPDQIWTKKPKMIFVSRDVKDVVISNYHFWYSLDAKRKMDETEYFDIFMNDICLYGPYREFIQNYLNIPHYENIMYITYEAMAADLDGTILNVAKFLGKTISLENRMKLKEHLTFENMKKNVATNNKTVLTNIQEFTKGTDGDSDNFIRKGIVGDYKNVMSQEYIERFNKWYAESDSLNQGFKYKDVKN